MSTEFKTAADVEAYLNTIPKFSTSGKSAANFNLGKMREFCAHLGDPQDQIRAIHVAGTNGKGTVCRMFTSVYTGAGYKTGLYTSPHLLHVGERFMIDGSAIPAGDLILFFNQFGWHIKEAGYTFFEITTAIAFWYFAKERVDVAVIETGLGGRLDATNVLSPELSVITSIGLDHTDILGNTLRDIAFEKGGIIKKNKPVIIGMLESEAEQVVVDLAQKSGSNLLKADDLNPSVSGRQIVFNHDSWSVKIDAGSLKKMDAVNAAIVFQGIKALEDRFPVEEMLFINGIQNLSKNYPKTAVFEKLNAERQWFFDGAHNEEATVQLTGHLISLAPADKWTVVLSFMKDKLNEEVARCWGGFPNLFVYQMEGERAATAAEMLEVMPYAKLLEPSFFKKPNLFETELVIFSGSFYFYSVVSNWMGTMAASHKQSFRTK